jgi:hypothetical protein
MLRVYPGLRINFHRSEVMALGASAEEHQRIANMLNFKKGFFPFTYLGLPISNRALSTLDWGMLMTKVGKRADPMGKFMSSAARLSLATVRLISPDQAQRLNGSP